jgi:hypothetical protein
VIVRFPKSTADHGRPRRSSDARIFFDGDFVVPNPVVPTSDGLSLVPYIGSDAGHLTVNGELNKLGHNVSFGHGLHTGIHWRSDSDTSLLLGEAVALSFLSDRAKTYNEPFTVTLTKFDGTTTTKPIALKKGRFVRSRSSEKTEDPAVKAPPRRPCFEDLPARI